MITKLICALVLLIGIAQRTRIAATMAPVITLPLARPDKIGAVR